ncbi:MAG: SDR family NAD(P)-dependent oxidoreductase [Gammaproteobacteria bacterium]|nr:SDR family NAD(P)-dependent oxidoreductase [Gammaproteobacteria bacterium]
MAGQLIDKVAFITGGNTGIGRAVALAYASEGAQLHIGWFERESEAHSLARSIHSDGGQCALHQLDVTDEANVEASLHRAIGQSRHLDILVNNAGIQRPSPIGQTTVADWDQMMNVHLRGTFLCSRAAASHMMERRSGHIINVCSQLGYIGREGYTAYSTAKGGVIAFTRALARELAPHGVLVNGVAPGLVDTGFDPLSEDAKREHAEKLPLGRLGAVDDMTSAFVFLAAATGGYYCGQILHPNGGEIMP